MKQLHLLYLRLPHGWVDFRWQFRPRDLWIGLYLQPYPKALDLYICILPMLPLNVYVAWGL